MRKALHNHPRIGLAGFYDLTALMPNMHEEIVCALEAKHRTCCDCTHVRAWAKRPPEEMHAWGTCGAGGYGWGAPVMWGDVALTRFFRCGVFRVGFPAVLLHSAGWWRLPAPPRSCCRRRRLLSPLRADRLPPAALTLTVSVPLFLLRSSVLGLVLRPGVRLAPQARVAPAPPQRAGDGGGAARVGARRCDRGVRRRGGRTTLQAPQGVWA